MGTQQREIVKDLPASEAQAARQPTDVEIRTRAFTLYQARAGADGDCLSDWLQAEHELRQGAKQSDAPAEVERAARGAREPRAGGAGAAPAGAKTEKAALRELGQTALELCGSGTY